MSKSIPPLVDSKRYELKWERGRRLEEYALLYLVAGQGAERLHYPSEFYLMQTFKRQTGLAPTQWRNRTCST